MQSLGEESSTGSSVVPLWGFIGFFYVHGYIILLFESSVKKKIMIESRLKKIKGKLSEREFAKRLGFASSTVRSYLEGRMPPADFIAKVCEVFNISEQWLLTGEGEITRKHSELKFGTPESELYGVLRDSGIKDSSELKKALELWKVVNKQINPDEDDRL